MRKLNLFPGKQSNHALIWTNISCLVSGKLWNKHSFGFLFQLLAFLSEYLRTARSMLMLSNGKGHGILQRRTVYTSDLNERENKRMKI